MSVLTNDELSQGVVMSGQKSGDVVVFKMIDAQEAKF